MKSPVLFIVFNRPDLVAQSFQAIRQYRPDRLYIAADGPRPDRESDTLLCKKTRDTVSGMIDWECDVHTLFREENAGCGRGVSEAISWMFEREDYGIILEDDCLPSCSFFLFCEQLLLKYKEEENVMQINGHNPSALKAKGNAYAFSRYPKIWGWATWKRAWEKFDFKMDYWPLYRKSGAYLKDFPLLEAFIHGKVWNSYYKELRTAGKIRAWDIQWSVAVFMNRGLCVVPEMNLVRNIGVGVDATNNFYSSGEKQELGELSFPLIHPESVAVNERVNAIDSKFYMEGKWNNLKRKVKSVFCHIRLYL